MHVNEVMILWSVWLKYLSCLHENKQRKQEICHTILYIYGRYMPISDNAIMQEICKLAEISMFHTHITRTKDGLFYSYDHKEPF